MKARLLKKILNNTGYIVHDWEDYIAVGSPMCHSLISVDKKTLKINYALDSFGKGRAALEKESKLELLFIYDKLQQLIDSGEIKDIIEGNDEIANPRVVYTVENGQLVETFTDAYDYPNVTIGGRLMYNGSYFKTKQEAINQGICSCKAALDISRRAIKIAKAEVKKQNGFATQYKAYLTNLESLKQEIAQ